MYKFILALVFLLIYPSTLAAQRTSFFVQPSGMWTVEGVNATENKAPVCRATTHWQDGSAFSLIADLYDGEIYIVFLNKRWYVPNFTNEAFHLKLVVRRGDEINDLKGYFEFVGPDTIRIRNIDHRFIDIFAEADEMKLIMPGDLTTATIRLVGSRNAIHYMSTCIKYYNITR